MPELEYKLTNDTLFKMMFVQHQNLLKRLVAALLGLRFRSIKEFAIRNSEIQPNTLGDKFCRLDISMTVDGQRVDLEIQVADEGDFPERSLFYWAREFSSALGESMKYAELPRTIVVSILAFNLFDCREFHSEFRPLEVTRHTPLTDRQVLHYFELPKLPAEVRPKDGLALWLSLFKAKTEEDLKRLEAMEVPVMKEAITAYRSVSATADFKEIERMRFYARHNEVSALGHARDLALAEGLEKGKAAGIAEGITKVVRNALRKKLPAREIAELTGLSVGEVKRLAGEGR